MGEQADNLEGHDQCNSMKKWRHLKLRWDLLWIKQCQYENTLQEQTNKSDSYTPSTFCHFFRLWNSIYDRIHRSDAVFAEAQYTTCLLSTWLSRDIHL